MKKMFLQIAATAVIAFAASANALAVDVPAGPIWDNADAQAKCPSVCSAQEWNGQWATTQWGVMSVCGTTFGVSMPVGPIWNNADAQEKCPVRLAQYRWSGMWTTIHPNVMSVCGCDLPSI